MREEDIMPIKVIQVGVGGFGTSWRHTLTTTPDVEVAALVDIDRDILENAAQFFGMPEERCFLNPTQEWSKVEADVVIDSTPQLHHHTNAMQALAAGKDLIVVKPMSDQWETGVAMVREAERRGRKMVVAQQLRFHPVIMKIREMVQSGALGHVGYIHQDAFFGRKGYGGSYPQPYPVLVQGAIHFFDYLRWVLGQDAVAVWADCWNPPWTEGEGIRCAYAAFEMSGGCRVCFRTIATVADGTNWTCNWRVEGEKGILKVVNDHLYFNDEEIPVGWEDDTDISDLNLPVLNKIIFEKFVKYVNEDDEPGFSGRNNLGSLEMAFGAIKSSETGQRYRMGQ
jgi:predicted dehydrogenase